MAHGRKERIRELLGQERDFDLSAPDDQIEEHREKAHRYRLLLLELKNLLQSVLPERPFALLNEIDDKIFTLTAVHKARAQLHGLLPDIEVTLAKLDRESEQATDYIESYSRDGSYSTPYIDLMLRAIKELEIDNDNQPVKDQIEAWLEEHGSGLSGRDIERMASFVRLPEKRKGGYHKSGKKKGGTQ